MVRPVVNTGSKEAWWKQLPKNDKVNIKMIASPWESMAGCRKQRQPAIFYRPSRIVAVLPKRCRPIRYWRRRPRGVFRNNRD